MKKISVLLLLCLLFCLCGFNFRKGEYVYDANHYLTENERISLNQEIEKVREEIGSDILIVFSEDTAYEKDAEGREEAEAIVDAWVKEEGGYNEEGQTILFLVNMKTRYYFIDEFNAAYHYLLTDSQIDSLISAVYPSLAAGSYGTAGKVFITAVVDAIETKEEPGEKKIEDIDIGPYYPDEYFEEEYYYREMNWVPYVLFSIVAGIVVTLIVVFARKNRHSISRNYYMAEGSFRETFHDDVYTGTTVERRRIHNDDNNMHTGHSGGMSHGGSGSHSGSSGHHGGGGHF